MPAPLVVMAIAAAIAAAAALIARAIAEGDYQRAREIRMQALDQYGPDILPKLDKATAEQVGETEFNKFQAGEEMRAQQLRALSELENVYTQEGMTEADRAALALGQSAVAAQRGGAQAGLQQMMARRGGGPSSGVQAALYSQSGQDAANAMAQMALEAQVAGRSRALQALEAQAGLAGTMREQDYRAFADRARAQDEINRFNAQQRWEAQEAERRRRLAEFGAYMDAANARSNIMQGLAAGEEARAASTQQTGGQVGNAALSVGGGAAQYSASEPKKKKD